MPRYEAFVQRIQSQMIEPTMSGHEKSVHQLSRDIGFGWVDSTGTSDDCEARERGLREALRDCDARI